MNKDLKLFEQYIPLLMYIALLKVSPDFQLVDDRHWAIISHGAAYCVVQGGSNF